jgi:predicted metal-dependent TIM-barrel fold hydrolase
MHIFDTHLHVDVRSYNDLEAMVLANVRWAVALSHDVFKMSSKEVYLDHYDRLLRLERERAEKAGLKLFVGFGVHPGAIPHDVFELLDYIPELLSQDGVVAVGETGLIDPNDKLQREVLKAQVEMARDCGKPILISTPYDHKKRVFNRVMKILEETDIPPQLVLIDHLDPNLSKEAVDAGYWTGVSLWPPYPFVQPENLTPALLFEEYDPDHLVISSDLSSFSNDPLVLPKLVLYMERKGVPPAVLEKIFRLNPAKLYKLNLA